MKHRSVWLQGVTTLGLLLMGLWQDSRALWSSWITVVMIWGMLPLGALAVLFTNNLTGGRWGEVSRPVWLALAGSLPLFAISLLPLLLVMDVLFAWLQPVASLPETVQNKLLYLNKPFFIIRTFCYLVLWLGMSWLLGAWSHRRTSRSPGLAAAGLILWFITLTFFGVDWFISLEPRFYSDVFGLMLCMSAASAALAAGIMLYSATERRPAALGPRRDIANLWLTLLLGWVFMAFSQYIIIWSGNLPDEIGWYLQRNAGIWRAVSVWSFALFFLVPFAVLLSTKAKNNRAWLCSAAGVCLSGHALQMLWLIAPSLAPATATQGVLTLLLTVSLGATYVGFIRHLWRRQSLPPAVSELSVPGEQHV